MKKLCLICQPFGMGDILFLQKIVWHCAALGYRIIFPLRADLKWLRYHLISPGDVSYPTLKEIKGIYSADFEMGQEFLALWNMAEWELSDKRFDYPVGGDSFLFLGFAALWKRLSTELMAGKYEFFGLDHKDWAQHVFLKRRPHAERELFYEVLGLRDNKPYTLVNYHCSGGKVEFPVPGRTVMMREIDGFTAIDWFMVIERAAQIATIDTSLVLLVEILGQQKPLYMISRYSPPSFKEIQGILKLKWNLAPTPAALVMDGVG